MRRVVIPVVSVLIAGSGILTASPAAAATINITNANCAANSTGSPISGAPGDVINISATLTGCRSVRVSKSIITSQSDVVVTANQAVTVLDQTTHWNFDSGVGGELSGIQITLGSGTGTVTTAIEVVGTGGPPPTTRWNVTFGGGGGGSSSGSDSTSAPAPIFQQFGKPAIGTCAEAASPSLNWAGVAGGGWGESWAMWMNGGRGGAVCTRTLTYLQTTGAWAVR
jgi:hypothetical protein